MFDLEHERHLKRMENIKKRKTAEEKKAILHSTLSDLHVKHIQFQTAEKVGSLDKTNKVLLDKLVKISKNQKPALYKETHWSGHPGTLNTTYRKKELERIAYENELMAKRLISQQSAMDRKKLKLDFLKQREFMRNSQRSLFASPKSSGKLPSIQSPKPEDHQKDFRIKTKKRERRSGPEVGMDSQNNTFERSQQEIQPPIRVEDSVQEHPVSTKSINNVQSRFKEAREEEDKKQKTGVSSRKGSEDTKLNKSQVLENKKADKPETVEEEDEKSPPKKSEAQTRSRKISTGTDQSRKGSKRLSVQPEGGEQLNKSIEAQSESKELKESQIKPENKEGVVEKEPAERRNSENKEGSSVEKSE